MTPGLFYEFIALACFLLLLCSGQGYTVYIQRVAVGDDVGCVAVEFGHIAVAGQRPGAGGIQGDGNGADLGGNGLSLGVGDGPVDAALKGGAVRQLQFQAGITADLDRADELLGNGLERRNVAAAAPAVRADGEQDVFFVLVDDLHALKRDDCAGVGHMEDVTVEAFEAAARHGKARGAAGRVARHGLVDHDGIQEGGVAVALGVVGGQIAVIECDGVEALDAHTLGEIGGQRRVGDRDIRRGVNGGRAQTVGGVAAAVHHDGSAAAVGTDGRAGPAGGLDRQIIGVGHTAARGHDAAGSVSGGGDDGIVDIQRGAVSGRTVLPAVSTVAEHTVSAFCVGGDCAACDGGRGSVLYQNSRVQTV